MLIRKIKEQLKKPNVQRTIVSIFFTVLILLGLALFLTAGEGSRGETKETRLQEEIQELMENREK